MTRQEELLLRSFQPKLLLFGASKRKSTVGPNKKRPRDRRLTALRDVSAGAQKVGPGGFEPPTHGLRVRCSTRLSYEPVSGIFTTSSLLRHPLIVQRAQAVGSQRMDFPRGFTGALVPSARPAVDVVRADW